MRVNVKVVLLIVFCLPFLGGCGYGPWAKKVAAFSTTAPPALTQASAAYTAANDVHTLEQEAVLVDQYATQGYHPSEVVAFLSDNDLAVRQSAIKVLADYANLVGDIALGKRTQDIATRTKALNQSMVAAKTTTSSVSSSKTKTAASMTPQQMGFALSGLDLAIKPLVEHKVRKHLPELLTKADPSVQKLCTMLSADMSDLRSQEQQDYQLMLMEQSQFIEKNGNNMSAVEKRGEIVKLVRIEADAAKADTDLTKAQKAIEAVAAAHHRLVAGETK